jgi:hypothetical protein
MHNQNVLPAAAVAVVPHGCDMVCPRRRQLACTATTCPHMQIQGSTFPMHFKACTTPSGLAEECNL